MKQRPILFNGAMVRAILSGQKSQTRRIVNPHRSDDAFCLQDFNDGNGWWPYRSEDGESPFIDGNEYPLSCPFGVKGDQLWVREAFSSMGDEHKHAARIFYKADGDDGLPWTPSIHMPRWASRISLEITRIRVEQLQDISEDDARAEGCKVWPECKEPAAINLYRALWDSINGTDSWDANPWVWVIEFKRVQA